MSVIFLKIILFIVSKMIIQSYVLSMVLKSLMFKFVSVFQHFHSPIHDTAEYR